MHTTRQRLKKRAWQLCLVVFLSVAVLLGILAITSSIGQPSTPSRDFLFADPSLSQDIFSDEDYMDLDRGVYYEEGSDAAMIRSLVREEDYASQSPEVQCLLYMLQAIQQGDAATYRTFFTPAYTEKVTLPTTFTMQKIYNISITQRAYSESAADVPAGYASVTCFGVRYMIKDNNGSFRSDMGSDCILEQFYYVVTDKDGNAWVNQVLTYLTHHSG